MYASTHWCHAAAPGDTRWAVGIGAAASRKAIWWDLRLASLLTHLLWNRADHYIFILSFVLLSSFFLA